MSDNNVMVSEDDRKKMMAVEEVKPAPKWSVKVMRYNIPYWLILVVVVAVVVVIFKMNVGGVCDKVRLCSESRARMSAVSKVPVVAATGASVLNTNTGTSSARSEEVRKELRRLFEQF